MNKRKNKKLTDVSKSLSKGESAKVYADAQKVIDKYHQATGRYASVQYSSASTSSPRRIANNGNFSTKVW